MGLRWLLTLGFVHMSVGLHGPLSLGMPMATYWGVETEPAAGPEREILQLQDSQPQPRPLSWKFPENPVDQEKKPPVHIEVRQPDTSGRVAVRCGESQIQVEVSQDLLGLGRLVRPEEVLFGGCSATEVDDSAHVLIFQSELHECGSTFLV